MLCLTATGCASLDAVLGRAEQISAEATERSLSIICQRISIRQWQASFGSRADAWRALCVSDEVPQ